MKKQIILLCILLLILTGLSARRRPRPKLKVELLGSKVISFRGEKDVIAVTRAKGAFRKILFKVKDNDVAIHKLIITYGNGNRDKIPVKWIFREGDLSKVIALKGNKRVIRKIVFYYKTVGKRRRGKAFIRVFGLH